jgi:ABC-type multidrug transport system fused ATPase/permease subunit
MIVVMEKGQIIETGKHSELYKMNGTYRRLYDLQFANN